MRALDVTTPRRIATANSSIDLNAVSSPGESSIRYIGPPLEVLRVSSKCSDRLSRKCKFHARTPCIFVHVGVTDAKSVRAYRNAWAVSGNTLATTELERAIDFAAECSFLQLAETAESLNFSEPEESIFWSGTLREEPLGEAVSVELGVTRRCCQELRCEFGVDRDE
jgi:hypothetical protein